MEFTKFLAFNALRSAVLFDIVFCIFPTLYSVVAVVAAVSVERHTLAHSICSNNNEHFSCIQMQIGSYSPLISQQ